MIYFTPMSRKENGSGTARAQIEAELKKISAAFIVFFGKTERTRVPKGKTAPKVSKEQLSGIKKEFEPLNEKADSPEIGRALELNVVEIVQEFARSMDKYGQNFRQGAGFACLVFSRLNGRGFNFPPVSAATVNDYKQAYEEAIAQVFPNVTLNEVNRRAFMKGMLLFGLFHQDFYEKENPQLIDLFQDFGSNKPFSTEGSILIYHLKIAEYFRSH